MGARGRSAGSAAGSLWVDAVTEHGSRSWDLSRRNPVTAGEESISSAPTDLSPRRTPDARNHRGRPERLMIEQGSRPTGGHRKPGGGRAMAVGGGLPNRAGRALWRWAIAGHPGAKIDGSAETASGIGTAEARVTLNGGGSAGRAEASRPEGWRAESRRNGHETGETMTAAGTRREHELPGRTSGHTEWATFAGSASQRRRPDRCGQERPGQEAR